MNISLTPEQIENLERAHRKERDGRIRDRIKAVLLNAKGWNNLQIAEALIIRPETVADHLLDYQESKKLKPTNGGSTSRLDAM